MPTPEALKTVVSIATIFVGLLMLLESLITMHGKGIDINAELPYMTFGVIYSIGSPLYLQLFYSFEQGWFWYLLIILLMGAATLGYIKVKGFTIRYFNEDINKLSSILEKVLKQQKLKYEKAVHTPASGQIIRYTLETPKIPIQIMENKDSFLRKQCLELLAAEALWNKELMSALQIMVRTSRKNRTKKDALELVRARTIVGFATVIFGCYLFFFIK